MSKIYKIKGMDCESCAKMIELDLEDAGILASCSFFKETLEIEADHDEIRVKEVIEKSGYILR